ncbi:DNA polymerase epsilon subunit C [Lipomyces oligophaga]|uniref:DNA polymerase epsilon subunit C n=1 Tax=Lipomyces oligophaga TaxID=45792 RepID=UPI0034D02093
MDGPAIDPAATSLLKEPLPIVKTRFPVVCLSDLNGDDSFVKINMYLQARIKKIMQADDDIGKVAQATPVVVSKALELFMISLVQGACDQARMRNARKVSPGHLKQAVMNIDKFDFLIDTVSKYPDPVAVTAPSERSTGPGTGTGRGRRRKNHETE